MDRLLRFPGRTKTRRDRRIRASRDVRGRPRIAIVTTIADAQWQFMRGQNEFLSAAGFELHAIASPGARLRALAERDGIAVHAVAMSREIKPLADLVALVRMIRILRQLRPEVLHASTPKAALLGAIAGWLTGVPVRVFLVRGLITDGARGLRKRLLRAAEALTVRLCHASYFTSRSLLKFAEDELIIRPGGGKILCEGMSNGVDLARFDPQRVRPVNLTPTIPLHGAAQHVQGPVIGYVGRLGRDKGLDLLWRAWQLLRNEFPSARLLIVGGWEQERPVDPGTRQALEDDDRVILTGRIEDVAPCYRAMTVFAFPSRREGFPNAPMEAAAMRIPVVATDAVGSRDAVVDGVTGRLTAPGDWKAFADAIAAYLVDPELARRHGLAGRRRVERDFQQLPIWRALAHELDRLLALRGLARPAPAETIAPDRLRVA